MSDSEERNDESKLSQLLCADCGEKIGQDKGPDDGWQLQDGRTVCHACCVADFGIFVDKVIDTGRKLNCVAAKQCQVNFETRH